MVHLLHKEKQMQRNVQPKATLEYSPVNMFAGADLSHIMVSLGALLSIK